MLVQTDEDLRPINPPIIQEVDVLWNPFEDIEPRSTREDREHAAAAKRSASLPEHGACRWMLSCKCGLDWSRNPMLCPAARSALQPRTAA